MTRAQCFPNPIQVSGMIDCEQWLMARTGVQVYVALPSPSPTRSPKRGKEVTENRLLSHASESHVTCATAAAPSPFQVAPRCWNIVGWGAHQGIKRGWRSFANSWRRLHTSPFNLVCFPILAPLLQFLDVVAAWGWICLVNQLIIMRVKHAIITIAIPLLQVCYSNSSWEHY